MKRLLSLGFGVVICVAMVGMGSIAWAVTTPSWAKKDALLKSAFATGNATVIKFVNDAHKNKTDSDPKVRAQLVGMLDQVKAHQKVTLPSAPSVAALDNSDLSKADEIPQDPPSKTEAGLGGGCKDGTCNNNPGKPVPQSEDLSQIANSKVDEPPVVLTPPPAVEEPPYKEPVNNSTPGFFSDKNTWLGAGLGLLGGVLLGKLLNRNNNNGYYANSNPYWNPWYMRRPPYPGGWWGGQGGLPNVYPAPGTIGGGFGGMPPSILPLTNSATIYNGANAYGTSNYILPPSILPYR